MRQIFLDTETTGLYPDQGDRLIEVGCVELINRKPTGNILHFYVNPGRDSHEEALKVHGITTEFLRDKPAFAAIADALVTFVQGAEVLIHNAPFDLGFLDRELALLGRPGFLHHAGRVVDTLAMAKELFPGKRNSLDALCERLGVDHSGRTLHGALLDAELLADVYIYMTRGQNALDMEASEPQRRVTQSAAIDLGALDLPVIPASAQELEAHEQVIAQIARATGGRQVWKEAGP